MVNAQRFPQFPQAVHSRVPRSRIANAKNVSQRVERVETGTLVVVVVVLDEVSTNSRSKKVHF